MSDAMTSTQTATPKPRRSRKVVATTLALAIVGSAGAVGATQAFRARSNGPGKAELVCRGGISQLGQILTEDAPIFEGDPETVIDRFDFFFDGDPVLDSEGNPVLDDEGQPTFEQLFSYRIEGLHTATHTGTHLDAPSHFIEEGARSVDELDASEFVWPAYIIDVRDRMTGTEADGFQLDIADIKAYEKDHGKIQRGSLVIVQTGLGQFFGDGTDAYFADAPGFSGDAVQWMIDKRKIEAIGSDTFGPDATSDADFSATYTILANDGVAIPGLANLDSMTINGDIVMAPPVRLLDGSAFQVNPLACHGKSGGHSAPAWNDDHRSDDDDDDDDDGQHDS